MTFSSTVKEEVSRLDTTKPESISELSAIIRNSASIDKSILIHLENNFVARRIYKLIKSLYDVTPVITVRKKYFSNGLSYILDVRNKTEEISNIFDKLLIVCQVLGLNYELKDLTNEEKELYINWEQARGNKDFETADKLRSELEEKGVL